MTTSGVVPASSRTAWITAALSAGGFVFAFSNVLGFLPVRGQGPAGND